MEPRPLVRLNTRLDEAVSRAAFHGDEDGLQAALIAGGRFDGIARSMVPPFFPPYPALVLAAQRGHARCLAILLAAGADPSIADPFGVTAMKAAASCGHAGCVSLLLPSFDAQSEFSPNPPPEGPPRRFGHHECHTPLSMAAEAGFAACVRLLLPVSNPLARDHFGRTPLWMALTRKAPFSERRECVALLAHAADPVLCGRADATSLLEAALAEADVEGVAFLAPYFDLRAPQANGLSLLDAAQRNGFWQGFDALEP